jgi:hypothetical protein
VVASFVTTWTGAGRWLVIPAVGVVVAMITALIQAYGSAPAERHSPGPRPLPADAPPPYHPTYRAYPGWYPPPAARRRGTSLAGAFLTIILVLGIGGTVIAGGVRYAVDYFTRNDHGTSRLLRPATASTGLLTLTVESVLYTADYTQVGVAARNQTSGELTLPLYGNCLFTGSDGTTLNADSFNSKWSEALAPGITQRGEITFPGHLPGSVLRASLSFTTIFGTLSGDNSITVHAITLTPA